MRTWVAPLILAMALTGCQDDSTNSGSTSKPGLPEYGGGGKLNPSLPANQIQGQLVDPYVADALVCLDISDNGVCDSGEPKTRSDANGVFTFTTLGSALSSAARILVINEGTLQYPHYGRHIGNDFHIALNGKLAKGNNSIIITPAVAALAVMATDNVLGPTPEVLASVLNDNFGTYFSVEFTAEDLQVDPYAQMITTDHARFVEVQKAQQVIAGLLLIFQNLHSWDGYDDFVNDFAANAAEPVTTTTTTENKPLYDLLLALIKQANAQSVNVLPTASENDLLTKANTYIEALRDKFAADMPSNIAYTELPELSNSNKANISAAFAEYFSETLHQALVTVFADTTATTATFASRVDGIASTVESLLTTQTSRNSAIYQELTSKYYLASTEVQAVLNSYSSTQLTLLGNNNQYYSAVAACSPKRFYLGYKATVSGDANTISSISTALTCTNNVFSSADSHALLNSFGIAASVDPQHIANMPVGSEIRAKGGCTIKGSLSGESSTSYTPVYLKNAATGEVISLLTDSSGAFAFKGLAIPAEVDGFSGYYFGTYSGVRGGYAAKVTAQTIKDVPVSCVADETQTLAVTLPDVSETTVLEGTIAAAILGEGMQVWLEQETGDLINGDNTLSDDGVDAVWVGEIIEEDSAAKHPYMTFNSTTGDFSISHLAAGTYRLRVLLGLQPGGAQSELISSTFVVAEGKTFGFEVLYQDSRILIDPRPY